MKAQMKKVGDTIVVILDGKIDYETNAPLREDLNRLVRQARKDSVPKNIIFNFERLEFVGSSGISTFVQTLREINATAPIKPRYCNVGSEFRKVIEAFDESAAFDFYDNEERARKSFLDN